MKALSIGKIAAGIVGLAVIGILAAVASGLFNNHGFNDGGLDINGTHCDQIAAARTAVNNEFAARKAAAQTNLDNEKNKISDDFWAENRRLDDAYNVCISAAVTADPCKPAFEKVSQLYEEIMADFDAGKGFNQAKFDEREQAKKDYNNCVDKQHHDEFFTADKSKCDADLAAGQQSNQSKRQQAEAEAQRRYETAVTNAQSALDKKLAILDAIEKKCHEPAANANITAGGLTAGGTGADVKPNSSACTGVFVGNDKDLQKQISDLESQLQKAKASGLTDGFYGSSHIQQALDDLKQQLKDSERTCQTDADCGDPTPVCCSDKQVGRVYCDSGVCANETTACDEPKICGGKPATCIDPATGAQQHDGINISRTISQTGACSQNLQNLEMQQKSANSDRFEFTGNIPGWIHIAPPGGKLPASVSVTYDCNTVQGFGPGTYKVDGTVQVYDTDNSLINTIPLNISITVTPAPTESNSVMIEVISYQGKYLPVAGLHKAVGPECDKDEHWHANGGSVVATDGTVVIDPEGCGFGKTKDVKTMSLEIQKPSSRTDIQVPGSEKLK